jgi:hypothetical protein
MHRYITGKRKKHVMQIEKAIARYVAHVMSQPMHRYSRGHSSIEGSHQSYVVMMQETNTVKKMPDKLIKNTRKAL